jgi:carbonic anhydrase/acetyltransferase-like protein (isoleucine patch superfamily)
MAVLVELEGRRPHIAASAFIAPTAVLVGDVEVGENASVWFGAVLRADLAPIRIGPACNVQDNVVIHAETDQGTVLVERVTVGHGAILHDCWIGKDALIGMGAILLDRARVGAGALVGAGSVVKERFEVPAGMLAVGNPAVNKKRLEGTAAEWVARGADDYLQLVRRYAGRYRVLS